MINFFPDEIYEIEHCDKHEYETLPCRDCRIEKLEDDNKNLIKAGNEMSDQSHTHVKELEATIEQAKSRCNVLIEENARHLDDIIWIKEALEQKS